jgi:D-glycerate 3-kinase
MLADPGWAAVFGITSDTVEDVVTEQSTLYPQIYPIVTQFWHQHSPRQTEVLKSLWMLWLPLALQLIEAHQALGRPLIQGVLGAQGSGKSTLSQVLTLILNQLGYPSLSLSLDDLYLTYAERQQRQRRDPRLRWRGPPGTHDVLLGIHVLDQLRSPSLLSKIALPRFDKSAQDGQGDRRGFESVESVKIVLFEGWFVGVRPIAPSQFEAAPDPIHSDQDCQFARDMNARLWDYLPLWERLDRLIVLNLADYRLSKQWRREAEQQAIAAGNPGMSDAEIDQFVEYFWRALHPQLFMPPLLQTNQWVDWVIEIDADHAISGIHPAGSGGPRSKP